MSSCCCSAMVDSVAHAASGKGEPASFAPNVPDWPPASPPRLLSSPASGLESGPGWELSKALFERALEHAAATPQQQMAPRNNCNDDTFERCTMKASATKGCERAHPS